VPHGGDWARLAMAQFAPGTLIWFPDADDVWKAAEVVSSVGADLIVKTEDHDTLKLNARDGIIHLRNTDEYTEEGLSILDDLTMLTHLHEPAVLHSLQVRFEIDRIYTFTGPILIAVNPFKRIRGLYDEEVLKTFITPKPSTTPHVFATSNAAYRGICDNNACQTVLISGESGAGKTETTKFVMKFLAMAGACGEEPTPVEQQVLQSNPLLEAMGNARTLRNDNSSRFGKFIELQFKTLSAEEAKNARFVGKHARLGGAKVATYLLEKIRVTDQQEGERNFHIFYQACAAAQVSAKYSFPSLNKAKGAPQVIDLTGLGAHSEFTLLTKSSVFELQDVNDVEEFEKTVYAMQIIGFSPEDIENTFKVMAGILRLGNIAFSAPKNNSEGAEVNSAAAAEFKEACRLLGTDEEALAKALSFKTIISRSERYTSPVNVQAATDTRDSLARTLYGTTFLYLVETINRSIGFDPKLKLFVGVLDIFGFECFKFNSFEQLCINFTNERLQQFFNTFVFKQEEALYKKEGIPWDPLDFPDNQDAVDLIQQKPSGIFAMLDEECLVVGGSDLGFVNKLKKQHQGNRRFDIIKQKQNWFIVNHFAGPVQYCVDQFLDKNKDQLSIDCVQVMQSSTNSFVKERFEDYNKKFGEGEGKKKKPVTLSSEFKEQLSELMQTVDKTDPHFVRCIKPNPQNQPDIYDRPGVTEQLRYGGVLQAVQVSRAGYPVRTNHHDCWLDYRSLVTKQFIAQHKDKPAMQRAETLLNHLTKELDLPKSRSGLCWAVGKTLVFFKQEAYEVLQAQRLKLRGGEATKIQALWKMILTRRKYLRKVACAIKCQALMRGKIARKLTQARREQRAAAKIGAFGRRCIARMRYTKTMRYCIRIQARMRGILGRVRAKEYRLFVKATKIQAFFRMKVQFRLFSGLRAAVHRAQHRIRTRAAVSQMRRLRAQAQEVGAIVSKLQAAQDQNQHLSQENDRLQSDIIQLRSHNVKLTKDVEALKGKIEAHDDELKAVKAAHAEELASQTQALEEKAAAATAKAVAIAEAAAKEKAQYMDSDRLEKEKAEAVKEYRAKAQAEIDSLKQQLEAMQTASKAVQEGDAKGAVDTVRQQKDEEIAALKEMHAKALEAEKEKAKQAAAQATAVSAAKAAAAASAGGDAQSASVIEKLRSELEQKEKDMSALKDRLNARDQQYKALLHSSSSSVAGGTVPRSGLQSTRSTRAGTASQGRYVDIQLVGGQGVGKSWLLERLIKECDPSQLRQFEEHRVNLVAQYNLTIEGKPLKMLDCSGQAKAMPVVEGWFAKAKWVVVIYDLCDPKSLQFALENALPKAKMAGANLVLFGNTGKLESDGPNSGDTQAIVMKAKDGAAQHLAYTDERSTLAHIVRRILQEIDQGFAPEPRNQDGSTADTPPRKGGAMTITSAVENFKNWFGGSNNPKSLKLTEGVLKPSLKGSSQMRGTVASSADLRAVQQLQDSESAVTCICFGQERLHKQYILLAAASKDGTVVIYRCYRTQKELAMMQLENAGVGEDEPSPSEQRDQIVVHSRLVGHSRAITSIFFNLLEDQLVTTSIDKSVRFWQVDTGEMLKVFTDSSPVPVAAFLPFNPQVFVAANSNAVLRLVNVQNGLVLQKLKVETEVRALRFDDTGAFLLAGTKNGSIHVLENSEGLKFKFKVHLARGGVTCITFVPARPEQNMPASLLVNTSDSSVTIIDCTYEAPQGILTNLTVRNRVKVAHSLLPLKCCFSPSGGGYLISGSEDREVYIYNLHTYKVQHLKHHVVPVVAVAVNQQDTLLASADSVGRIVLWRRLDFSHLAEQ